MTAQQNRVTDADELPPGTTLCGGQLTIEACLGRGGVATVYRVRDSQGHRIAAKLMVTRRAADGDQRERFDNEWRILRALRGLPHVVQVQAKGRHDDGRPFFTMELLESPTLADLIVDREVTIKRACQVVRQVAEALDDLHARGVIHRDIKPDNIIVEPDGIRLLDFGYAYSQGSESLPRLAGLTSTEHRPGTPLYMAPEQADGEPPEASFDIYALATTLYEALVGHAPNSELPPVLMMAHKCLGASDEELSIDGRVFGLPRALVKLVDDGLRRDPKKRVQTAAEFRDRLDFAIAQMMHDRPVGRQERPVVAMGEVEPEELAVPVLPLRPFAVASTSAGTRAPVPEGLVAGLPQAYAEVRNGGTTAPVDAADSVPSMGAAVDEGGALPAAASERPQTRAWILVGIAAVALLAILVAWCGANERTRPDVVMHAPSVEPEPSVEPAIAPGSGPEGVPSTSRGADDPLSNFATGTEGTQPNTESGGADEPAPTPSEMEAKTTAEVKPAPRLDRTRPKQSARIPRRPKTPAVPPPGPDVAAEAKQAKRAKRYGQVLTLTKSPRCWDDEGTRVWLRVQALSELQRYAECAAFASSKHSAEARRMARSCSTQIDKESPQ